MAKVTLEASFDSLTGKLDQSGEIYYCKRFGKNVVSHYPKHKNPKSISQRQRDLSANFSRAIQQAKTELDNPERRAYWQKQFNKQKNSPKPYVVLRNFVIASLTKQNA